MSFTITATSLTSSRGTSPVPAGRLVLFTMTRTGGSTWTSQTPFSVVGITGAFIVSQTVTATDSATVEIYTGDAIGTLVVADSVNSTTATVTVIGTYTRRTASGSTWYVLGGISQVPAPFVTPAGDANAGTTTYCFQIIGVNSAGKTLGFNTSSYGSGGQWGPYITTISTATNTIGAGDSLTLSWNAVTGATGYDVLFSTDGSTWKSLALNQAGTTFSFTGQTGSTYTLPTANSTALGSDSNDGTALDAAHAFATMAKAASVAQTGDAIVYSGVVVDTTQVTFPAGLAKISSTNGEFADQLYSTYKPATVDTHVSYAVPSSCELRGVWMKTDQPATALIGCVGAETANTDIHAFNCRFHGMTNVVRINVAKCAWDFIDCETRSNHGTFGLQNSAAGSVVNMTRCSLNCTDTLYSGVDTVGQGTTINLNAGALLLRETACFYTDDFLLQRVDSTQTHYAIQSASANAKSLVLINARFHGPSADFSNGGTNLSAWLMNTPYNADKNPTLAALSPTVSSLGTYLFDPLLSSIDLNTRESSVSGTAGVALQRNRSITGAAGTYRAK